MIIKMVYTITFNPAIDYILTADNFESGVVNRTDNEKILFGGKGINVSVVLKNLGIDTTALGFEGGFTGAELMRLLENEGVKTDFVSLKDGMTRINVKLKGATETEINASGPKISPEAVKELFKKLENIKDGDFLVLAGSVPKSVDDNIYCDILEHISGKNINVVVDACGDLLLNVLKYKPFLIKPNNHELGEIFSRELKTEEEIIECAKKLIEKGAHNVLVSMAAEGAVLVCQDGQIIKSRPPKGKVINSTGAGDSMVAGFIAGYMEAADFKKAFRLGLCAGSASTFSENLATAEEIHELYERSF